MTEGDIPMEPGNHRQGTTTAKCAPPQYLQLLDASGGNLVLAEGAEAVALSLSTVPSDEVVAEWAESFLNAYVDISELDVLRDGTSMTRAQYLEKHVLPSAVDKLGRATRAGDFAELLVSDYLEHRLGYWISRIKYSNKDNPNGSAKGVDVVGYLAKDYDRPDPDDELIVAEVKAALSSGKPTDLLQLAIDHSGKDSERISYTLHRAKQLCNLYGDPSGVRRIQRFQNATDRPYQLKFNAVAVYDDTRFSEDKIAGASTKRHPNQESLSLMVIHGPSMMNLVHRLYEAVKNAA